MSTPLVRRSDVDACPGALRLHAAADGPLARIRLPGGLLTGEQLRAVRELAEAFGDGHVELTSRANLQLRALAGAPAETLGARLAAAGLLPSPSHELVRNIAASPPADSAPAAAVRPLVAALDQALCADPRLASLPGRFLFALDSGALDVAGAADVAAVPASALPTNATPSNATPSNATPSGLSRDSLGGAEPGEFAVLLAGLDAGLRVTAGNVVGALLAAAHAFLDERAVQDSPVQDSPVQDSPVQDSPVQDSPVQDSPVQDSPVQDSPVQDSPVQDSPVQDESARAAWRVRELVDGPARVAVRVAAALGVSLGAGGVVPEPEPREPVGIIAQPGGFVALGATVPLGRLSGVQMKVLEKAEAIVVTPWRGVVLPDLSPSAAESWRSELAAVGLEVESGSRWSGVTACAGLPGCAKSLADVRLDATSAVLAGSGSGLPVHWVGCARGCGSPAVSHVRVEATGSGYQVRADGFSASASTDEVGALVAAARRL